MEDGAPHPAEAPAPILGGERGEPAPGGSMAGKYPCQQTERKHRAVGDCPRSQIRRAASVRRRNGRRSEAKFAHLWFNKRKEEAVSLSYFLPDIGVGSCLNYVGRWSSLDTPQPASSW